jgi:hypothetical protein
MFFYLTSRDFPFIIFHLKVQAIKSFSSSYICSTVSKEFFGLGIRLLGLCIIRFDV